MISSFSKSNPIFIGGMYKSGTSLLRAMLGQHSNIAGGLETFWFDLDVADKNQIKQSTINWDATRKEPLEQHISRLADFFDFDKDFVFSIIKICTSPEEFIDRFMSEYAALKGKKRWLEKTPANILHIERIFAFWPNAYFIHVVRDPRDVYSSNALKSEELSKPEFFARLWIKFISAYEEAKKNCFPRSMIEIRYEDLVLDPAKTMRRVLDFVHEPWEIKVAGFYGEPQDLAKVRKITGITSSTLMRLSRPLATDRIGAWKKELFDAKCLQELEWIIQNAGFSEIWNAYKYSK